MTVISLHLTSCLAVLSVLLLKKPCVHYTPRSHTQVDPGETLALFLTIFSCIYSKSTSGAHPHCMPLHEGEGESTPFDLSCNNRHEKTNPLKEVKLPVACFCIVSKYILFCCGLDVIGLKFVGNLAQTQWKVHTTLDQQLCMAQV